MINIFWDIFQNYQSNKIDSQSDYILSSRIRSYIRPTKIRPKADNSLARHPFSYKERPYWNSPFRGAKFSGGKGHKQSWRRLTAFPRSRLCPDFRSPISSIRTLKWVRWSLASSSASIARLISSCLEYGSTGLSSHKSLPSDHGNSGGSDLVRYLGKDEGRPSRSMWSSIGW